MVKFLLALSILIYGDPLWGSLDLELGVVVHKDFHPEAELLVSRKGILELHQLSDNKWQILPLRKGVVTITQQVAGQKDQKTLVRVKDEVAKRRGPFAGAWRGFLCQEPGVSCDLKRSQIFGETSSWRWFLEAKKRCQKVKPCVFKARLGEKGQKDWQEHLIATYGGKAKVDQWGRIDLSAACQLSKEAKGEEKDWHHYIKARCDSDLSNLHVKTRIFWLKEGDAERLGIKPWGLLQDNLIQLKQHELSSYLQKNHRQILGEPQLSLVLGEKATLRQGFDVLLAKSEGDPSLVKGGLELQLKPIRLVDGRLKIELAMNLRLPGESRLSYDSSELKTQIWLSLGQRQIAGSLALSTQQSGEEGVALLSGIPIIAPLFRSTHSGETKARLYVELIGEKSDFDEKAALPEGYLSPTGG